MTSFDERLVQLQHANEFEIIHDALLELVMDRSKHFSLNNKLQPFLPDINDGGNLNALCVQLQNPYNNHGIYVSMVHNVVNASKTCAKLKTLLKVIIGIKD